MFAYNYERHLFKEGRIHEVDTAWLRMRDAFHGGAVHRGIGSVGPGRYGECVDKGTLLQQTRL